MNNNLVRTQILEEGPEMGNTCVWVQEPHSSRAWWVAKKHPEEDSEHPSVKNIWRYCPYCGVEIEFRETRSTNSGEVK